MKTRLVTLTAVAVLCALAACKSPPQYHPWGVGGTVFWDNVKKDW